MSRPSIVNIINFVRGIEPREPIDLYEPVRQQLALLDRYDMPGTFLLQYDALIDENFTNLLVGTPHEISCWVEIVEPLCQASGIPWRGRFPWDWHAHVGFTVGYTLQERERLMDAYMEKFYEIFGKYPKSAGSWLVDAHTLGYLSQKYGIVASCNCKDQWGTDGYTLWGGYYMGAYYPSKTNVYAPAQQVENQIPVPIFKMLGSDPVYQYDIGLSLTAGAAGWQQVVTLEPVYVEGGGGGNPAWTQWFFDTVMAGDTALPQSCCLAFRYAQVGQENSFGWPAMAKGLENQFEHLQAMRKRGRVRVETLADSGVWFRAKYPLTPNASITALRDWKGEGRKSIWFCSRRYRANLFGEGGRVWLRDLTLFDDGYQERYLHHVCDSPEMVYDNLPIMDGNRWSGNGVRAGCYFMAGEQELTVTNVAVCEDGDDLMVELAAPSGTVTIRFASEAIEIVTDIADLSLRFRWGSSSELDNAEATEKALTLSHEGFAYKMRLLSGTLNNMTIAPENRRMIIAF